MTKAVESGMPKLRIEEAAARRQARVDRGEETIVGVNKYRLEQRSADRHPRHRQHRGARASSSCASNGVKATRDPTQVRGRARRADRGREGRRQSARAVDRGDARARDGRRDLRRARDGLRPLPRRRSVRSPASTAAAYADDEEFQRIRNEVEAFATEEGRRPRILVAKLGQDGHDRGAKVIATAFADLGFDVDIGPLFQTPEEAARDAIENDVHVVGISSQAAGHKTLVPAAHRGAARSRARDEIVVVVGGVIPRAGLRRSCTTPASPRSSVPAQHPERRVGDPRVDPTQRGRVTISSR